MFLQLITALHHLKVINWSLSLVSAELYDMHLLILWCIIKDEEPKKETKNSIKEVLAWCTEKAAKLYFSCKKAETVQIKLHLHCVRRDLDLNMPFALGWVRRVLFCCLIELAIHSCPSPVACYSPSPRLPPHHRCFGALKSAHLTAHTVAFLELIL